MSDPAPDGYEIIDEQALPDLPAGKSDLTAVENDDDPREGVRTWLAKWLMCALSAC